MEKVHYKSKVLWVIIVRLSQGVRAKNEGH